ncbi:MAG: hypothetical protein QOF24_389 [Verrucomicrobiota bacterium]
MLPQSDAGGHRLLAMTVHNIGFLLDRLGQDCHPLQFIRELTRNSMEAIQRAGVGGSIIWDFEPMMFELEGVRKLCIIDTGDGMTGEEMVRFINQLSSSMSEQSLHGNYGVGAKIAAATRNPAGVSYFSWKNGQGSMILLYRDALTGQYGLKQWERADKSWAHYLPIEDELKPSTIGEHGTMVVLHGRNTGENTLVAPEGADAPRRWITRYLNTRYFDIPAGIEILCREGNLLVGGGVDDVGSRRAVLGQAEYLQRYAAQNGSVSLDGASACWWIIREKDEDATDPIDKYSGHLEARGHVAALYQNELYEMSTGRAGMSRLQQFGITFGHRSVIIYVEPDATSDRLTTNTARTSLLIGNEALPWSEWAAEFREKLPAELKAFVESHAPGPDAGDSIRNIRDRLRAIIELYKVSRYRPAQNGMYLTDINQMTRGGKPMPLGTARVAEGTPSSAEKRTPRGKDGSLYALFERRNGTPSDKVQPDIFPEVSWVSVNDGSRDAGDMEDRAAKYLSAQNLLLVNGDFRVFRDLVTHFMRNYKDMAAAESLVTNAVRGWFAQALVEAVIGVQALRNSKEWTSDEIERALSEEALTACVMQRYHVHLAVKRELGAKIGSAKSGGAVI